MVKNMVLLTSANFIKNWKELLFRSKITTRGNKETSTLSQISIWITHRLTGRLYITQIDLAVSKRRRIYCEMASTAT